MVYDTTQPNEHPFLVIFGSGANLWVDQVGWKGTFVIPAQLKWRKNYTFRALCKLQPAVLRSTLLTIYKSFIELRNDHGSILYN